MKDGPLGSLGSWLDALQWSSRQSPPLTEVRDSNLRCDYGGLSSASLNISAFVKVPKMGISITSVIRGREKKYYPPKSIASIKNINPNEFF